MVIVVSCGLSSSDHQKEKGSGFLGVYTAKGGRQATGTFAGDGGGDGDDVVVRHMLTAAMCG